MRRGSSARTGRDEITVSHALVPDASVRGARFLLL